MQLPSWATSTWRSPWPFLPPPSIGAVGGTGYGPGSDSEPYLVNLIGTLGWEAGTIVYGIP